MLKSNWKTSRIRNRVSKKGSRNTQGDVRITLSGKAVRKMLVALSSPAPRLLLAPQEQESHLRPTLRPWIGAIDQIVKDEAAVPKKFQSTAMRILKLLREEYGYSGCYSVVQEYVHDARVVANPDAPPRHKSHNRLRTESCADGPEQSQNVKAIIPSVVDKEQNTHGSLSAAASYLLSQYPQRARDSDERVLEWMQGVQQGSIPLDTLTSQLSDISAAEVKILLAAATKGDLPKRNKAIAMLAYSRGISSASISSFLQISSRTLFRYWKNFTDGGTPKLFERKPRSDKKSNNEFIKSAVFTLLHSPPSTHGFNRTTWRMADLRSVLCDEYNDSISCDIIHTIIMEAGWKWRQARVVLTSNDPDYRAKVDAIKKTLSVLKSDEAFFSIDEYGPFAIKKKGGVKRVAPGQQYVVPQWQKSKGWLILTAALELSKNQVTHFYSRKKNTDEMIKLANVLRSKYSGYSTIYLSWDAASWHVSKDLTAHLEKINQLAASEASPIVKTMPLPAGAQFLNVIESVFSGMARAIIHNSDYPSLVVATEAIDRYFADRNEEFRRHPRRAGKKIWGLERVPSMFAEDQNCKDPMYQNP